MSEEAYLMQVIAIAITVNSSMHLCSGMILLYQVQQLCVALCPDGLHSAEQMTQCSTLRMPDEV